MNKRVYHIAFYPLVFLFCWGFSSQIELYAQEKNQGAKLVEVRIVDGEKAFFDWLPYCYVYAKATRRGRRLARKRDKLRRNVYKVYPYVMSTSALLDDIDSAYAVLGDSRDFKNYKKRKEKELLAQYKPVVKEMTYAQGKIIVLLINRESGRPAYDVIKELRGGVQATFWQGVAKLFDNNLKRTYEPEGKDLLIEQTVQDIQLGIPY